MVGEEAKFILNFVRDGQPVQGAENRGYVVIFAPDPGSAVLNMLQLLQAPARDPDEEGVAVIQSRSSALMLQS